MTPRARAEGKPLRMSRMWGERGMRQEDDDRQARARPSIRLAGSAARRCRSMANSGHFSEEKKLTRKNEKKIGHTLASYILLLAFFFS